MASGLSDNPSSSAVDAARTIALSTATLTDPNHADRLPHAYAAARSNLLWLPLERILQDKVRSEGGSPLDPALQDYILLITILVAFLEATAQQLRPYQPPLVMGFGGLLTPRLQSDDQP